MPFRSNKNKNKNNTSTSLRSMPYRTISSATDLSRFAEPKIECDDNLDQSIRSNRGLVLVMPDQQPKKHKRGILTLFGRYSAYAVVEPENYLLPCNDVTLVSPYEDRCYHWQDERHSCARREAVSRPPSLPSIPEHIVVVHGRTD